MEIARPGFTVHAALAGTRALYVRRSSVRPPAKRVISPSGPGAV